MDAAARVGLGGVWLVATMASPLAPDSLAKHFGIQFGVAVGFLSAAPRANHFAASTCGTGKNRSESGANSIDKSNKSGKKRRPKILKRASDGRWSRGGVGHRARVDAFKTIPMGNDRIGGLVVRLRVWRGSIDLVSGAIGALAPTVGTTAGCAFGIGRRNSDSFRGTAEVSTANFHGDSVAVRLWFVAANHHAAAMADGYAFNGPNRGALAA